MAKATPCVRLQKRGDKAQELLLSDSTMSVLAEGRQVRVPIKVGSLPEIIVEIQGRTSKRSQFYSDLADAIIDAFNRNGITS